jgi:hypothetical protein
MMPRAGRTFEEGRINRVDNRLGGGWMAFDNEKLGERFIEIFVQAMGPDEATSFGWRLLGNQLSPDPPGANPQIGTRHLCL